MATATATQPDLPDEMLEEIFLRLLTAADLARASMACSSFRGVITDHSFLRRFRTLHPPPLLGIISTSSFLPAQPPHLSAAAARTLANADFSCSFLPTRERWERHDFRDGRALMAGVPEGCSVSINDYDPRFLDMVLAVCDPLHRRYVLLPAIPDDLTALVDQPDILDVVRFLSPSGEDEEYTSFTVLCLVECRTKLILFVFSSGVGQWQAITFDGWGALVAGSVYCRLCYRYCVRGCFCWPIPEMNKMLLFDTRNMEFSSVDLPPGPRTRRLVFVEAAEGRLGMFTLPDDESEFPHVLRYAVLRNDGDGPNQWRSEATISVPVGSHYKAMGVAGGYLLLQVIPEGFYSIPKPERPDLDCFTLFEVGLICIWGPIYSCRVTGANYWDAAGADWKDGYLSVSSGLLESDWLVCIVGLSLCLSITYVFSRWISASFLALARRNRRRDHDLDAGPNDTNSTGDEADDSSVPGRLKSAYPSGTVQTNGVVSSWF